MAVEVFCYEMDFFVDIGIIYIYFVYGSVKIIEYGVEEVLRKCLMGFVFVGLKNLDYQ